MLKGFKTFISRGNAIDLAVGVVIGAAFGAITTALVDKFINPLIAGVFGQPNFDDFLSFTIGEAVVQPGAVLTALVNFLLVAAAIYFLIVVPMNKLAETKKVEETVVTPEDVKLLTEIRDLLAAENGSHSAN